MRRSFTTTSISRMFGVDKTTIAKWIDAGKLKGFKTSGGHRRVFPEDLITYFKTMNITIPQEVVEQAKQWI